MLIGNGNLDLSILRLWLTNPQNFYVMQAVKEDEHIHANSCLILSIYANESISVQISFEGNYKFNSLQLIPQI